MFLLHAAASCLIGTLLIGLRAILRIRRRYLRQSDHRQELLIRAVRDLT